MPLATRAGKHLSMNVNDFVRRLKNLCCYQSIPLAILQATLLAAPLDIRAQSNECPLSPKQEGAAVRAFKKLGPLFKEPRCLNCHGAVNPFSRTGGHGGGWIDIRKEVRDFLRRPDARDVMLGDLTIGAKFLDATVADLNAIANSAQEITDNEFIRRKAFRPMREACAACHIDAWIIPMRDNHFVGRSTKEICVHMKTSSLTNTPVSFLHHVQSDELVVEGFKGRRGLLGSVAPQRPAMSPDAAARHANDWVAAMNGKFHSPPDCGCLSRSLLLRISHRYETDKQSASFRSGGVGFDGEIEFDVALSPAAGRPADWIYGEATLVRQLRPQFARKNCTGSAWEEEVWDVQARVDAASDTISLVLGFDMYQGNGIAECRYPGHTTKDKIEPDLRSELGHERITLQAREGIIKTLEKTVAGGLAREVLSVTVLDVPSPELR